MARISITVDGVRYDDDVEPRTLLVYHLREQLGKVGTVVGCDTSNCGACTVLMSDPDGRLVGVKSCAVLAVQADGRQVVTIEGLAGPDNTLGLNVSIPLRIFDRTRVKRRARHSRSAVPSSFAKAWLPESTVTSIPLTPLSRA